MKELISVIIGFGTIACISLLLNGMLLSLSTVVCSVTNNHYEVAIFNLLTGIGLFASGGILAIVAHKMLP